MHNLNSFWLYLGMELPSSFKLVIGEKDKRFTSKFVLTYFFHTSPSTFSDGVELLGLSDAIAGTPGVEAVAFPTGPIPAGLAAACNSAGRIRNAFQ